MDALQRREIRLSQTNRSIRSYRCLGTETCQNHDSAWIFSECTTLLTQPHRTHAATVELRFCVIVEFSVVGRTECLTIHSPTSAHRRRPSSKSRQVTCISLPCDRHFLNDPELSNCVRINHRRSSGTSRQCCKSSSLSFRRTANLPRFCDSVTSRAVTVVCSRFSRAAANCC